MAEPVTTPKEIKDVGPSEAIKQKVGGAAKAAKDWLIAKIGSKQETKLSAAGALQKMAEPDTPPADPKIWEAEVQRRKDFLRIKNLSDQEPVDATGRDISNEIGSRWADYAENYVKKAVSGKTMLLHKYQQDSLKVPKNRVLVDYIHLDGIEDIKDEAGAKNQKIPDILLIEVDNDDPSTVYIRGCDFKFNLHEARYRQVSPKTVFEVMTRSPAARKALEDSLKKRGINVVIDPPSRENQPEDFIRLDKDQKVRLDSGIFISQPSDSNSKYLDAVEAGQVLDERDRQVGVNKDAAALIYFNENAQTELVKGLPGEDLIPYLRGLDKTSLGEGIDLKLNEIRAAAALKHLIKEKTTPGFTDEPLVSNYKDEVEAAVHETGSQTVVSLVKNVDAQVKELRDLRVEKSAEDFEISETDIGNIIEGTCYDAYSKDIFKIVNRAFKTDLFNEYRQLRYQYQSSYKAEKELTGKLETLRQEFSIERAMPLPGELRAMNSQEPILERHSPFAASSTDYIGITNPETGEVIACVEVPKINGGYNIPDQLDDDIKDDLYRRGLEARGYIWRFMKLSKDDEQALASVTVGSIMFINGGKSEFDYNDETSKREAGSE